MTTEENTRRLSARLWLLDEDEFTPIARKLSGADVDLICKAILAHKTEAHRDLCRQLYNMTAKDRIKYLEKHKEPPPEPEPTVSPGPNLA